MDDGDCLVLLRSEPPVIDHKFDLMRHPNVKLTPDGGAALTVCRTIMRKPHRPYRPML